MVAIRPVLLKLAKPAAVMMVLITLLPYANQSQVLPTEFALFNGCQGMIAVFRPTSYAFHLADSSQQGSSVKSNNGGLDMQVFVDYGETKNIGKTTWEWLKVNSMIWESTVANIRKMLYLYASTTPLKLSLSTL